MSFRADSCAGFVQGGVVRLLLGCLLIVTGALSFAACSGEAEPAGARYSLRGIVRDVSQLGESPPRLRIEHEAIDHLVGVDGTLERMESMTMNMVVWEGAQLPGGDERNSDVPALVVGDKVRFILDVDWLRTPTGLIVDVQRLAESEVLDLADR